MIGDVKMQTIKRGTGRSLTGDRPLFLALVTRPTVPFFQKTFLVSRGNLSMDPIPNSKFRCKCMVFRHTD